MLESWFQASLQLVFIMTLDIYYLDDSWDLTFTITSLTISCVSVLYGLSTFNLRNILRNEPSIMKTLLFTLTELITSTMIFLYLPAVWLIFLILHRYLYVFHGDEYEDFYIKTLPVLALFTAIPILGAYQISLRILRPSDGYFSQDYRMNLCLKCKEQYSLSDMVLSRRRLLLVNLIYALITTSAVTIG